jgi:hypothetical protein
MNNAEVNIIIRPGADKNLCAGRRRAHARWGRLPGCPVSGHFHEKHWKKNAEHQDFPDNILIVLNN